MKNSQKIRAVIKGTGMCIPDKVVTNNDLTEFMDTSDEWIRQRSGIEERRFLEPGRSPNELAIEASKKALEMAHLDIDDIDLIIAPTLTPIYMMPGNGVLLQSALTKKTIPALDIRNACSGYVYALSIAKAYIESGIYKNILICANEIHSRYFDFSTEGRTISVLFGDGCGSTIISAESYDEAVDLPGLDRIDLFSEGEHADRLWVQQPGSAFEPAVSIQEGFDEKKVFPYMDGKYVFKNAVKRMPEALMGMLDAMGKTAEDVDLFLFHQANMRINDTVLKQLGQPEDKTYNNIQKYGNCSAASIPICLDECVRQNRIKSGDLITMTGFGSGFSWASAALRWA